MFYICLSLDFYNITFIIVLSGSEMRINIASVSYCQTIISTQKWLISGNNERLGDKYVNYPLEFNRIRLFLVARMLNGTLHPNIYHFVGHYSLSMRKPNL